MTAERRESVGYLKIGHEMSERGACEAVNVSRTVYRYVPLFGGDQPIIDARLGLRRNIRIWGSGSSTTCCGGTGTAGTTGGYTLVYCAMKLNKRRKYKRRVPARHPEPLSVPDEADRSWSADFMSDPLNDGRRFRTFNVIDDHRRECLAIEIDLNIGSRRVMRILDRIAEVRWLLIRCVRASNG
ncbi:MAG: hypothetical protein ACRD6X_11130 [Pyrinomonadaceae bacterium]